MLDLNFEHVAGDTLEKEQRAFARRTCAVIAIFAMLSICVYGATRHAGYFDGYFANGAFQLFDPMRRLHAGQRLGLDFQMFHGVGVPIVHYPIFAIFGHNLYASEVARYTVSPFFFMVSTYLVLFSASRSSAIAAAGTAVFLVISHRYLPFMLSPGGSLLGVRTGMAVVCAAPLMIDNRRLRWFLFSLSIALTLAISTEQGIAVLLAAALVGIIVLIRARDAAMLASTVCSIALATLLLWAICGPGFWQMLRYNYGAVLIDQAWYFGGPPNPFGIDGLKALWAMPAAKAMITVSVIALLAIVIGIARRSVADHRAVAALFLVAYGFATLGSLLGYITIHNIEPFVRAVMMAVVVCFVPQMVTRAYIEVSALIALALTSRIVTTVPVADMAWSERTTLGVHLSPRWQQQVDAANRLIPRRDSLWSDYAGVVEADHGSMQPSSDYLIHALGPQGRQTYVGQFIEARTDWVRTDNACAWMYGTWLLQSNWAFFRELFTRYQVRYADTMGALFERSSTTNYPETLIGDLTVDSDGCASVTSSQDTLLDITMQYQIVQPPHLPLLRSIPRYYVTQSYSGGEPLLYPIPIGLPANGYGHEWTFPLRLAAGTTVKLCPVTRPKVGGANMSFISGHVSKIEVPPSTLRYLDCRGEKTAYHVE